MPTTVTDTSSLLSLNFWQNLPQNSRLLVSKAGELVERKEVRPGFFGRLLGRKVRFVYRILDPQQERPQRIAVGRVMTPQESRQELAKNLIMHMSTTLTPRAHSLRRAVQGDAQGNDPIARFIANARIYINQTIQGNPQGNFATAESATAMNSDTVKGVLRDLGQKINYLQTQLDNAQAHQTNDLDKKAFVYNSIFETKNVGSTTPPNSPQEFYKFARSVRAVGNKDSAVGASPENVAAFGSALKHMAQAFFTQNSVPDSNPNVSLTMRFIDGFLADSENNPPETTLKLMDQLLDNLPEALADITYEAKNNTPLRDFRNHIQQFFPQATHMPTAPLSPQRDNRASPPTSSIPPPKPPRVRHSAAPPKHQLTPPLPNNATVVPQERSNRTTSKETDV